MQNTQTEDSSIPVKAKMLRSLYLQIDELRKDIESKQKIVEKLEKQVKALQESIYE